MKEKNLQLTEKDIFAVCKPWPHKSSSIDHVHVVNVVQFLESKERVYFVNELYRVLKPGAKAQIVAPHWCSARAHGDLAFVYPPISECWFPHLNATWRKVNAPWSKGYRCNFDHTLGYGLHPGILNRNMEYQQHACTFWKEAAQDLIATLIKTSTPPTNEVSG